MWENKMKNYAANAFFIPSPILALALSGQAHSPIMHFMVRYGKLCEISQWYSILYMQCILIWLALSGMVAAIFTAVHS